MKAAEAKIVRKAATNLSVGANLVPKQRPCVEPMEISETAIREAVGQRKQETWREENREAVECKKAMVAHDGLFRDQWRNFCLRRSGKRRCPAIPGFRRRVR